MLWKKASPSSPPKAWGEKKQSCGVGVVSKGIPTLLLNVNCNEKKIQYVTMFYFIDNSYIKVLLCCKAKAQFIVVSLMSSWVIATILF